MSRNKKTRRGMSSGTKWVITFLLVIVAISMVIICAKNGVFHFEAGTVTANDDDTSMTSDLQDNGEKKDDEDNSSKFTVFVTAGNGGTANPTGSISVEPYDSITVSFTPDDGYEVESVTLDGKELGAVDSYTLSYIEDDHNIVVTFTEEQDEPDDEDKPQGGGNNSSTNNGNGNGNGNGDINSMISDGISEIFGKIFGD